ncbi:MAG: cysteine synthase A [Candidatus Omnitrophota bacterium]|jgi:cysteine synthase A|nr:MAG: cysteine synthase A [Candidatus Omnitrophota bacterium]
MPKRAMNILELIGDTPIVRLNKLPANGSATVWAKLEAQNPAGCVKERIGLFMIEAAEKKGVLKPGGVIVEPTSGNTGIGLAMAAAVKGYRVILTMPETMSLERRKILTAFGAEIVLTEGPKGMKGAVDKAEELVRQIDGAYMPQQFNNPANVQIHYETTGPEIWEQTEGRIDAFVSGIGTGGTLTGAGKFLKEKNPNILLIGIEPASSAVLSGGKPGPHKIQGIGAGFKPEILDLKLIDKIMQVSNEDAMTTARALCREEGILAGISCGAACFCALELAKELGPGKDIVVILPDTGERYLSTELFPYTGP